MSLIPANRICFDCSGYLGLAALVMPHHACKCPQPERDPEPCDERFRELERRFRERGGLWL